MGNNRDIIKEIQEDPELKAKVLELMEDARKTRCEVKVLLEENNQLDEMKKENPNYWHITK